MTTEETFLRYDETKSYNYDCLLKQATNLDNTPYGKKEQL